MATFGIIALLFLIILPFVFVSSAARTQCQEMLDSSLVLMELLSLAIVSLSLPAVNLVKFLWKTDLVLRML